MRKQVFCLISNKLSSNIFFFLSAGNTGITIAHRRSILKNQKAVNVSYLDIELSTFVKIFEFNLVIQSLEEKSREYGIAAG